MPAQASTRETPSSDPMPLREIVPIDPDLDGKESVHHMEAAALSNDPKVAALQADIEDLLRLSEEDYEVVHRRLVRKVSSLAVGS